MIPKIIHYCWFGGKPLPEDAKKYIESWRKYCPDYEIKEWNESNFNLDMYPYVREAYDNRKFAFVSDVARLYAMHTEGGIYMDTDVEVLKSLDKFLKYDGFSGFESSKQIPTGIMASCQLHPLVKEWLDEYKDVHFVKINGSFDMTTNVTRITNSCLKYGFIANGKMQTIKDFTFFPSDYFCPKNVKTGIIELTDNSYTIHHFSGSWLEDWQVNIKQFAYNLHKKKMPKILKTLFSKLYLILMIFKHYGFRNGLNICWNMKFNQNNKVKS